MEMMAMMAMMAIDLDIYSKGSEEIKALKRQIDDLKRSNGELEQKVADIYGAYETLQYSFRGRCEIYSAEISRLRGEIERLKKELRERGGEEQ